MARRVVIHLGVGLQLPGLEGRRALSENEAHFCYDIDPRVEAEAKRLIKEHDLRQVRFFRKPAYATGLKAACAHEVHVHNLLCEKRVDGREIGDAEDALELRLQRAHSVLSEVRRILRPDGCAYLSNLTVPANFPLRMLEDVAGEHGFNVELLHSPERKGYGAVKAHLGSTYLGNITAGWGFKGYLVKLTMKK